MRFVLKLLAAPFALALSILTAFFSFVLSMSNVVFGIASGLVFIGAILLLAKGETAGGAAWMAVAFLVSPLGLPALAGWLVKKLGGAGHALKGFIFG